jgi:hypothetical protein
MSNQPFAFPPPPPPPPKRTVEHTFAAPRGRGGPQAFNRGRGGYSRARGQHQGAGRGRGAYQSSAQHHNPNNGNAYTGPAGTDRPSKSYLPAQNQGSAKRSHSSAFESDALRKARPRAPPAVPSFSASLAGLLDKPKPEPAPQPELSSARPKPKNGLGLTPAAADESESEDDNEEERKLAEASRGQDLQFSYRGQSANLRTPEEIAAWIAERKRRYPTQAKREAAQKEAEEKRKKWQAEKDARMEKSRLAREQRAAKTRGTRGRGRAKPEPASAAETNALLQAKLHAEKLRRKALKAQRDLVAAEAALEGAALPQKTADDKPGEDVSSDDSMGSISDSSVLSESSSDSSSDSDSDATPEIQSSKVQVEALPLREDAASKASSSKRPCKNFLKTGRCTFGDRCRYSHEVKSREQKQRSVGPATKPARKSLYQVMVEREQDEEHRVVLNAIIALGKQGFLDEAVT